MPGVKAAYILTSPTANSDATEVYWADEWMSDAGVLSSDILMQQEISLFGNATYFSHGRRVEYVTQTTQQGIFRNDGMSFRPQIADDTLIWLSTAPASTTQTGTPTASQTPLVATPQLSAALIPRTEPGFYAPTLDSSVRGQVLAQPLYSDTPTPPISLNNTGAAHALQ